MYRLMQPSDKAAVTELWQRERGVSAEFVETAIRRFAGEQNVYVAEENDRIEAVALAVPVTLQGRPGNYLFGLCGQGSLILAGLIDTLCAQQKLRGEGFTVAVPTSPEQTSLLQEKGFHKAFALRCLPREVERNLWSQADFDSVTAKKLCELRARFWPDTVMLTPEQMAVVLGNLYCMGTAEKPVVFTSDTKKPADWGGIICGYNSQEVVLSHVDLAYAGATPTESSPSYQNKLYKTTIDGGLPAFYFCNTDGSFVMTGCFFHDNYNDQTYFSGGNAVIYNNILADSGNAADGGEGINIKAGCKMDVANNVLYNICTNGFKLSNSGNSESVPLSQFVAYNNTIVDCGWRRSKNKKGGSVWIEKAIAPTFVGNLIYDCRFGMKQPAKNGGDIAHSVIAPNYYFASTETGVKQMSRDADMAVWSDLDIKSATAGDKDPLFNDFKQNPKMNINCEIDDPENGAPLPFDRSWDFNLKANSPAMTGASTDTQRLFPNGIAFIGMKKVIFANTADDQNYRFCAPAPVARFGAKL